MRRHFSKLITPISVIVILAGVSVMLAWVFDIAIIKSFLPGSITMKFTTALCFVCAGVVLLFINRYFIKPRDEEEIVILLSALVIFVLMGTMLLGVLLDINIGLGNLFVRDIDIIDGSMPGKPSLGTMVSFFLIALAGVVAVRDPKGHQDKIFFFGLIVTVIGSFALIGYALGFPYLYWDYFNVSNAMAVHTAFLFVLLGAGLILLPKAEDRVEAVHYRSTIETFRWSLVAFTVLPIALIVVLALSSLRVWISTQAIDHLETISFIQEKRIQEVIRQYESMAEGISSRIQLREEVMAVNNTNNLATHNIKIQNILISALEPMDEIKEVALYDDNDKLLLITPQKDKYLEYQSFLEHSKEHNFIVMKVGNTYSLYLVEPLKYENRKIGTLVFNFGTELFNIITEDYTGLGRTGEMLLAFQNKKGDIEFLHKVRDHSMGRILKNTEIEIPVVQTIINKKSVTLESSSDYRGVPVIAVAKYLEDLDWAFVVKMDKEEIFSGVEDTKRTIRIVALITILFAVMTAHLIGKKFE